MAALRNRRKLVALTEENHEEPLRQNMAKNSNVPGSQEDYNTQVSEEFQGRVTKKLSQEFSKRENRILGALAQLDDFLLNSLFQDHTRTAPETSRNAFGKKQGTNEDDSESDPHPDSGFSCSQTARNSDPEISHDMLTAATEQIRNRHEMVTGVQKESLCGHAMLTGVHDEVTYCSPSTSSGKQKKNPSTNQPQFCSENTTPLQRSNQTKFCWPFSSWQITTLPQTFVITSTVFWNCQSP